MKKILQVSFFVSFVFIAKPSFAYEIETHDKLSETAHGSSVIATDPNLLPNLGIKGTDKFVNSKNEEKAIVDLIRDGSRFEDSLLRPINHFYDPISGDALLPVLAKPSPTWALEDTGSIVLPLWQRYSFADARDYFHNALTLPDRTERDMNFGLTFESLGRVIHHIQDMAQPQHVRLDSHLKLSDADRDDWFFENGSRYEKYTKDYPDKLTPLFGLYAPVIFPTARSFWHTGQGNGLGLAEFTNRNFVSAGTNFDNPVYPRPFFSPSTEHDENANLLLQSAGLSPPPECLPPNTPCVMTFYRNPVDDTYRPALNATNDRTSTWSIFDQDLKVNNLGPAFSLNRFNFDAAHTFLIPRAVGYSAGLIDYFFRGKLDFVEDPTTPGAYVIKNLGNEPMTGTFTLYYDAIDGNRYPVAGDAPDKTWAARTIAANGQLDNLSFIPPANPAPKWSDEYMLVFNGDMGEEKALGGGVGAVAGKVIGGIPAMPKVAAGTNHVLMTSNGQVKATGNNGAGQLGHDNSLPNFPYRDVFIVDGLDNVTNVAAIRFESFALKRDGSVWGWGSSAGGYIPVQVPGLTDVKQISGSAALKRDGTVWVLDHAPLIFSQIPGLSNVKRIAGGREITVALLNDGSVYVYGDGYLGIFGDGSFGPGAGSGLRKVPITDVVGITAGLWGVLAWKKDGTLWGWGFNYDRQLGVNMQISATQVSGYGTVYCYCNPTPAQVTEVSGVTSAVLGRFFSLVNENSSKVWKMGDAFSYPYYPRVIGTNYTDEMAVTDLEIVLVNAGTGAVTITTTQGGVIGDPIEVF